LSIVLLSGRRALPAAAGLSFNETKAALLGLRPGLTHLSMMTLSA